MKTAVAIFTMTAALAFLPAGAHAVPISGTGAFGSFTGTFDYAGGIVHVVLTNTSAPADGGYITAFVFNLPAGVSGVAPLTSSDPDFGLIGAPSFSDSVNAGPYGQFDVGASTFKSFEGGGAPSVGIGVGDTASFFFTLAGSDLDGLTEDDFLAALSVPPGDGGGHQAFVARFRGFESGASDKVPVGPPPVPEPATLLLLGLGLTGLAARRLRSSR